MEKMGIVRRLVVIVILVLIGFGLNYLATPAMSIHSAGFWWFIFGISVIGLALFAIAELPYSRDDGHYIGVTVCGIIEAVVLVGIGLNALFCSELFHASEYRQRVEIVSGDFSTEVMTVGDKLPIVDVATAQKVGDRTIASVENSSWYDVDDEYNLIQYRGEYYRISPLKYGGLLKWNRAKKTGIPGYVLVNARTQEATFVECEHFKISPSGYFGDNLKRHLRGQFSNLVFGGVSFFEIDEDGKPYWVTAVKDPTVGLWSNRVEKRFVVTNAVTGNSDLYNVEDLPEWVDHAFDLSYLMDAISDNFAYVNGFWNAQFSKTGVNKLSYNYKSSYFAGYNSTITAGGEVVFSTAITPANQSESILGFIQANPRTGEVRRYEVSGAEESSAQAAAQSLVSNFGYYANYPTVINVDGVPTYFMNLKDAAGLVQRYSLVNVSNYTIVVEDTSLEGAVAKYRAKINHAEEIPVHSENKTGIIAGVYQAQIGGYTYFYFTLESDENLYMSSIENGSRQVLLESGMQVAIEYIASDEVGVLMVTKISF